MRPRSLKWSSRQRPWRDAFGFMGILALPKASRTVLRAWIWAAVRDSFFECAERRRIWERNRRRLEDFPEPVMPLCSEKKSEGQCR